MPIRFMLGQRGQKLARETVITVQLSCDRRHLGLGELPDRLPGQLLAHRSTRNPWCGHLPECDCPALVEMDVLLDDLGDPKFAEVLTRGLDGIGGGVSREVLLVPMISITLYTLMASPFRGCQGLRWLAGRLAPCSASSS